MVVLALVIAFLVIEFGVAVVAAAFGIFLAVLFVMTFLAFCVASRALVRSVFMIPVVALRLELNILSTAFGYAFRGFRPLYPQWTLTFEITCKMMRFMFEEYGEVIAFENAALLREPFAMHGKLILKSNCRKHNTRPEQIHANGMNHMWMRDPEKKQHRVVVIHYHGGGFAMSDP
ncbi:hypothetical protein V7S43_012499 [Phytophthora oleae]|uniref:Alpha/beta hydrolase fold-3 domain-containing protein n=1 Tax=Phytophthora oleae TaxID=2107226 RepID=A0ABD3F8M0_9STRA